MRSPLITFSAKRLRVSAFGDEAALQVGHRGAALIASRRQAAQKVWPSLHPEGDIGVSRSCMQIEQVTLSVSSVSSRLGSMRPMAICVQGPCGLSSVAARLPILQRVTRRNQRNAADAGRA